MPSDANPERYRDDDAYHLRFCTRWLFEARYHVKLSEDERHLINPRVKKNKIPAFNGWDCEETRRRGNRSQRVLDLREEATRNDPNNPVQFPARPQPGPAGRPVQFPLCFQ